MCIRDRSNGAFVLTSYEPAATAFELVKNADYYDADRIALDGLNYQVIKDSQQALMSYQNGDLDITLLNGEQVEPVSYTHLDVYKRQGRSFRRRRLREFSFSFTLPSALPERPPPRSRPYTCLLYTSRGPVHRPLRGGAGGPQRSRCAGGDHRRLRPHPGGAGAQRPLP